MTSNDLLKILSKPWLNVKDIEIILECGRDKATNIRDSIILELVKNGKRVPRGKYKIVPSKDLIEYLELDIDYIYNMANLEKKLLKEV